jgi:hypothetical protein
LLISHDLIEPRNGEILSEGPACVKIFAVGTLRYTKASLFIHFSDCGGAFWELHYS